MPRHDGGAAVRISVVIPVYRDWARLPACLAALEAQRLAPFEIIVVGNDGQSPPPDLRGAGLTIIHEERPGSYAARNAAVAISRGDVLAFTDADCIPDRDWLSAAQHVLSDQSGVRVTGPVSIFRAPGGSRLAWLHDLNFAFLDQEDSARGICPTANLVVARTVFDLVGAFDASLMSGGDVEWSKRASRLGIPLIFDPAVRVGHPSRDGLASVIARRRRIAGAHPYNPDVQALSYVRNALKPPLRELGRLRGAEGLGASDRAALFLLLWCLNLVGLIEYLLVAMRLKRPERR